MAQKEQENPPPPVVQNLYLGMYGFVPDNNGNLKIGGETFIALEHNGANGTQTEDLLDVAEVVIDSLRGPLIKFDNTEQVPQTKYYQNFDLGTTILFDQKGEALGIEMKQFWEHYDHWGLIGATLFPFAREAVLSEVKNRELGGGQKLPGQEYRSLTVLTGGKKD
jgi:hypothetical protein